MAQDIEEFLRMAAARKKQQAKQQSGQSSAPAPPPPKPKPKPKSQPRQPGLVIGEDATAPSSQIPGLQSSIRSLVSTDDIVDHATHLGEVVSGLGSFVDQRVHQKFDHDLGRLQKKQIRVADVVDHGTGVEDVKDITPIIDMLRNPKSLKQAIILKEILDRPEW